MKLPMNTNRTSGRGHIWSLAIGLTIVGFVLSLVALVCFKHGSLPWDIQWFSEQAIDDAVLQTLQNARLEVVAAALVTLNFILLFLRLGHRQTSEARELASVSIQDDSPVQVDDRRNDESAAEEDQSIKEGTPEQVDSSVEKDWATDGEDDALSVSQNAGATERRAPMKRSSSNSEAQMQIAADEIGRLRRELVSCKQQLETANSAKAQFLANMSHELRTPMNGIMGMTDLLLGGALTAREERFVSSIAASSTSLLAIINDLLDFSKIESGILQLEHGRFSVRDCVEDVCASLAGNAHAKNIELICYVDENVPKIMDGDPGRVRQILNNLINNAIAFTKEGEVVVRLSRKDVKKGKPGKSVYHCDVQDTGVGITPELQLELFDAFTQADESNTRGHGGLGMGLAITRQLVSMMNGEISFRSRLGEGSRFSFSMELDDVSDAGDTQSRRRSLQGAYVLVVDDNETNRTILYHQLSNWGLIVETVESGALALQALRAAHDRGQGFDVLILDLHMPQMDGIQLAKAIQAEPDFRHIQSIMLTSAILQLDGMELRRLGIYKYVSKPARQSVLHDSLASLMPLLGGLAPPSGPPSESQSDRSSLVNAKVLLVEDNPVNQDVAMGMLEQLGCEVELATDGAEAVSKGAEEKYDIVLMDCQMPLMDGYEATRQIKSGGLINAPTPIVALTANAMDGDREKCLMAGMDDYVSKPVRTQVLSHMLEKWVGKPTESFDKAEHSTTPALMATGDRDGDLPDDIIDGHVDVLLPTDDNVTSSENSVTPTALSTDSVPDAVENVAHTTPTTAAAGVNSNAQANDETAVQSTAPVVNTTSSTLSTLNADNPAQKNQHEPEEQEAEAGILNMKAIDTIRGLQRPGKPDLLGKVVGVYFDKTPEVISSMRDGLIAKDYNLISASAHSLKSSSAYLGADVLSKTCRKVESAIADNHHVELESLVSAIESDYRMVAAALADLTEQDDKAA